MKGLVAEILKFKNGSCDGTANFSSRVDEVTIVSSEEFPMPEIFEACPERPAVKIIMRRACGKAFPIAVPVDENGEKLNSWNMFSGSFVYSHDSRFPFHTAPVMLFDRTE